MTVSGNGTPTLTAASPSASMSVTGTWGSGQTRTANHLLVAAVTCYGTTTSQLGPNPAGWRLDRSITANTQTSTVFYTKTATGADTAPTVTAATTGTAGDSSLQVVLFDLSDNSGNTPIVAAEGAIAGTSGTLTTATAQKVLATGSLGVLAGITSQGTTSASTTWTTPSGWTLAADQVAASFSQMTSYTTTSAPSTGSVLSAVLTHSRTSTEQSAAILVISPPGSVTGTTYYVSPTGSNSNAGTSTGTAWQTIAHVNGLTFNPGDTVLFQGGQTFSGTQLVPPSEGTSDLPVTFGSYGGGQATISVTATQAIFALNVGGITCQNLTLSGTAPSGDYNGGFHFEAGDGGQHPAVTVTGCSASGFQWGATAIGDTNWSGFGTVTITGCTLNGNTYAGVYTNAQGNPGVYTFGQVTVTGNTCSSNPGQTGGTTDPSGFGIYVGAAGAGLVSGNVIANNGASNPNSATGVCGILIGCSDGVIVSGNVIYGQSGNVSDGDGIDLDTYCISCTVEYNIIYNCTSAGILLFALGGLWGGNVVRWNVLWGNCQGNFGFFGELSLFSTISTATQIYQNTIVAHGGGTSASGPFFCDDSLAITGSVSAWNNIFYSATTQILYTHVAFTTTQMELQGNCWYYSGTPNWNWAGTTYTSLASFRTGTGQEKLSGSSVGIQVNPGLVNATTSPSVTSPSNLGPANGMMLASGSPCTGTGLPLLADFSVSPGSQDFFGNQLSATLPIGAAASPVQAGSFPGRPVGPQGRGRGRRNVPGMHGAPGAPIGAPGAPPVPAPFYPMTCPTRQTRPARKVPVMHGRPGAPIGAPGGPPVTGSQVLLAFPF